jgi:hypothetical protein
VCLLLPRLANAQFDVLSRLEERLQKLERKVAADSARIVEDEKSTFYLYKYLNVHDSTAPSLKFGAYIDTYYARYSDSVSGEFQKFPTSAPRANQFGLNMLYLGAQYAGRRARGNVGIHFGDIATSSWSEKLNLLQEANLGIRLHKRFWLDAGFFRTHIGVESIQPRENICQSIAVTTYYDPYFLSGVKLSYQPSEKFTLQLQAFNGFNNYFENNTNKAFGASAIYVLGPRAVATFNTIYSDESPSLQPFRQRRLYNDFYYVFRGKKLELGAEANFGYQTHTQLKDSTKAATMYSLTVLAKYKFGRLGIYGRGELFEDSNEILTGPIQNQYHQLVGINVMGATLGLEIKPLENTYLRLESRYLQTDRNEAIFYRNGTYLRHRWEGIAAMGIWF